VVRALGKPGPRDVAYAGISSKCAAFLQQQQGPLKKQGLAQLLDPSSLRRLQAPFVQLIRGMLQYNPRHRLSCVQALTLPLFAELEERPSADGPASSTATSSAFRTRDSPPHAHDAAPSAAQSGVPEFHRLDTSDIERCPNTRVALLAMLQAECAAVQQTLAHAEAEEKKAESRKLSDVTVDSLGSGYTTTGYTSSSASSASLESLVFDQEDFEQEDFEEQEECELEGKQMPPSPILRIPTALSAPRPTGAVLSPAEEVQDAAEVGVFISPSVGSLSLSLSLSLDLSSPHSVDTEDSVPRRAAPQLRQPHRRAASVAAPAPAPAPAARKGGGLLASVGRMVGSVAHGTHKALRKSLQRLDGFKGQ